MALLVMLPTAIPEREELRQLGERLESKVWQVRDDDELGSKIAGAIRMVEDKFRP